MTGPSSPVAFVLSGGGSLGAIQVGMLHALYERGIKPDLIVATSVGAGQPPIRMRMHRHRRRVKAGVRSRTAALDRDGRAARSDRALAAVDGEAGRC